MTKVDELKTALAAKGLNYVGNRGTTTAPVCLIGEAPGADEDSSGSPFMGASGRELDRLLHDAGVSSTDCWWTYPFRTKPPDNKIDRRGELGITDQQFLDAFYEDLHANKPTIIVPLGPTPLGLLCPATIDKRTKTAAIAKYRGSLLQSPRFDWPHYVIPAFHPAYLFRAWDDRPATVLCLAKAAEELAYWKQSSKLLPVPQRSMDTDPSFYTVIDYLRQVLQTCSARHTIDPVTKWVDPARLRLVPPVSIDIENIGVYSGKHRVAQKERVPYVIGLAFEPLYGMSIDFAGYDTSQMAKFWRLLDRVLGECHIMGQNYYTHDMPWLNYVGFQEQPQLLDDTIVRHHVLWPELSHKLDFQTFQYTREPYYKDEGKNWSVRDRQGMKRYNVKDVCVALEAYQGQEKEFDEELTLRKFYDNYAMPLARAFYAVNKRGILIDKTKQETLRKRLFVEQLNQCSEIGKMLGNGTVVIPKASDKKKQPPNVLNLSSPKQVIETLKTLGLKVPIKWGRGTETSDEEALNELFAKTGHPILKRLLRIRELNKTLDTYVNVPLDENNVFYSAYFVTGTVTGRRSSRLNFLGLGGNGQNLPKHSDLGTDVRECMVARPGKLFLSCDQVSAEDWIIQGIIADQTGNKAGLIDLAKPGRHDRLASFIFNKPVEQCGGDSPERYMAKRVRYAGSYDMGDFQFAATMAKEGFIVPQSHCKLLLTKFHQAEPSIRGVFQKYVIDKLNSDQTLTTPFGRRRQFFSLRSYSDNTRLFKEGYAQIPQSTVGDNTGQAVLWLEQNSPGLVVADGHDAVLLELDDTESAFIGGIGLLQRAFNREICFVNGLKLVIPIEFEVGYNLKDMKKVKCESSDKAGLTAIYNGLPRPQSRPCPTISGALPQLSAVR